MGPPSYMRSVVDRNFFMRCIPVVDFQGKKYHRSNKQPCWFNKHKSTQTLNLYSIKQIFFSSLFLLHLSVQSNIPNQQVILSFVWNHGTQDPEFSLRYLLCHEVHSVNNGTRTFNSRVQLKRDGTRWRTGGEGKGTWRMDWVASTLHTTSEHGVPALLPLLPLLRTPRLPVVDRTDAPADLNGLVRFAERRNLVSARVPSHFNWPLRC